MRDDIGDLVDRIQSMPDSRLVAMLRDDREEYAPEALSIAEEEVEARGGLDELTRRLTQYDPPRDEKGLATFKGSIDSFFSRAIGREASEKYPGLSYVSIAMRLISFILGTLAVGGSILAFAALFSEGAFGWVLAVSIVLQAGIGALLFYGGSELINIVIDIEKNTNDGCKLKRNEDELPIRKK